MHWARIGYFYDILIEGSTVEEGYEKWLKSKGKFIYIYNFKLNIYIFFIFKNLGEEEEEENDKTIIIIIEGFHFNSSNCRLGANQNFYFKW